MAECKSCSFCFHPIVWVSIYHCQSPIFHCLRPSHPASLSVCLSVCLSKSTVSSLIHPKVTKPFLHPQCLISLPIMQSADREQYRWLIIWLGVIMNPRQCLDQWLLWVHLHKCGLNEPFIYIFRHLAFLGKYSLAILPRESESIGFI